MHHRLDKSASNVLIAEDDRNSLRYLVDVFKTNGYWVRPVTDGAKALAAVKMKLPDIVLLDINIPTVDGYEVCKQLKADKQTQHIPVIFISGLLDTFDKTKGFSLGGVDYITKPFAQEEVLARVKTHLENSRLVKELGRQNEILRHTIDELQKTKQKQENAEKALQRAGEKISIISKQEAEHWGIDNFVGSSEAIASVIEKVRQMQELDAMSVLILGESGTGKELLARAIHYGGIRAQEPFIAVNCSVMSDNLAQSQIFGHLKGAFTGAVSDHKGFFECAHDGSLFLDEIGDMPVAIQAQLLRVLEDGRITPIGSQQAKRINTRIIAATNNDLQQRIASGTFRQDLYFRLARFTIEIPPLRKRREDIPLLISHFLQMLSLEMRKATPTITPEALDILANYQYPGNIRELRNIIEYAIITCNGKPISPEHLKLINHSEIGSSVQGMPCQNAVLAVNLPETERILQYVEQFRTINNSQCQKLLATDMHHASYLLKKLKREQKLVQEGYRRGAYYRLP